MWKRQKQTWNCKPRNTCKKVGRCIGKPARIPICVTVIAGCNKRCFFVPHWKETRSLDLFIHGFWDSTITYPGECRLGTTVLVGSNYIFILREARKYSYSESLINKKKCIQHLLTQPGFSAWMELFSAIVVDSCRPKFQKRRIQQVLQSTGVGDLWSLALEVQLCRFAPGRRNSAVVKFHTRCQLAGWNKSITLMNWNI